MIGPAFLLFAQTFLPIAPSPATPGAFGTQWTTELWLYNGADADVVMTPIPSLAGTTVRVPAKSSVQVTTLPSFGRGMVLDGDDLHVQLQVRERSRGEAVVIPTPSLDAFASAPLQLLNVPLSGATRASLRLYVRFSNATPASFTVRVFDMAHDGVAIQERQVIVAPPLVPPPSYVDTNINVASIDLPQLGVGHARIEIIPDGTPRFWAFASVTDNATQHVLIVTP